MSWENWLLQWLRQSLFFISGFITELGPVNPAQALAHSTLSAPDGGGFLFHSGLRRQMGNPSCNLHSMSFIQWPKNGEAGTKFTDQLLAHLARVI